MAVVPTWKVSLTSPWNLPCDPLEALLKGDAEPFEAFVPMGLAALTGFFRRRGAGPELAEDLSQDVLMKLVQNVASYKPDGRFAAFVFRVGRNAWIDDQRRLGARPKLTSMEVAVRDEVSVFHEPTDPGRAPGEALELADEAAIVRAAMAQLSASHRDVFELGVVQELGYNEVASILGVPVGTVKSRMFHALRALRGVLGVDVELQND